jgi:hypothetical protein
MIDIYRITAVLKVETGTQRDIQNWHYCFYVDAENIAGWDLRKNGRISDNGVY